MANIDHKLDAKTDKLEEFALHLEKNYKSDSAPSRFVLAFVLFAVLNVCLASTGFKQKAIDFPVMTWTSWSIKDYLKDTKKPDVVFLGSSLMLVPLDGTDADFLNKKIDASQHHKSYYFEDAYKMETGKAVDTFNFALPGEMPSDAYLITDFLLKAEKAPKVLVYGVGPRDFMDNLLPSPAATDPYRYLSRFGDLSSHANLLMSDWQERLNWELGKLFFLYGVHGQIALESERLLESTLNRVAPRAEVMPEEERIALRRKLLPTYLPFQVNPKEAYFRPTDPASRGGFMDNVQEYRKRYKNLKMGTFNAQMTFLNDLIAIANSRGTHVVLVAMPITQINRELLPDASWNLYKDRLKALAAGHQVTYFDMHATGEFKVEDFQDTVHLHSGGGAKLLSKIAKIMAADAASAKALP